MEYGAVATAFPSATEKRGNHSAPRRKPFDAAAAAAWALSVCEPSGSGLGGQTTVLIRFANGGLAVVDGNSYAPEDVSLERVSRASQRVGFKHV